MTRITIPQRKVAEKPPYAVPTMAEIRAMPWNGFKVASTFAGGGGSSTGYRMAGFQVVYANEFIEAARDTYAANAAPYTVIDGRDIRTVTPLDLLERIGMKPGELDVFDGSPPCASFSTAGKREKGWGVVKKYSDGAQRSDDLFFEFARLLEGIQPKVFVAENVSGLVKGTAKGYYKKIFARLEACGYRVQAQLLNAAWLGVPQSRERTIFIGVRNDLGIDPAFPAPLAHRYTIRDVLPWISEVVHDTSGQFSIGNVTDRPCPTITVGPDAMNSRHYQVKGPIVEAEATIFSPKKREYLAQMKPGENAEKYGANYFGLQRSDPDRPSNTILAGDGAPGVSTTAIHPTEHRRFSIGELRKLGGFPDDFELVGTYQQQWERIGRAVPPLMMRAVAIVIRDQILGKRECAA